MQNWNIAVTVFSKTPLLDTIRTPDDLRKLKIEQVRQVADELRQETIDAVSVTGGHFGAGLGVVELTTAIHYTFDTPRDRLIGDVGNQAYPHKILTGRRDRIRTLRTGGGLSGFTKRTESDYDPFGAAHSSTSISAGLGMAVARDLSGGKNNVIAVIGDGAMSAGMAYEAMNNAGAMNSRLIVILNDNDMSIAPPVGAMSAYLSRLYSGKTYRSLREAAKQLGKHLPKAIADRANRAEAYSRGFMVGGGTLFEELGCYYVGPIDGHNLDHLLPVLKNVRDRETGPVLVHLQTQEGKGYGPEEASADAFHDAPIQRPPIPFATDRAGLAVADGAPPAASFANGSPGSLPNFVIMAASYESELVHLVATQVSINDRPSALRYPRGEGRGVEMPEFGVPLEIGKGRIVRQGTKIALLAFGTRLAECEKAADELAAHGLSTTIADARFMKPLDVGLVLKLAREHEILLTIEEGAIGGFGSHVMQTLAEHGMLDGGLRARAMVLPDVFFDHDTPNAMYARAGLDAKGIVAKVFEVLGKDFKVETVKLA